VSRSRIRSAAMLSAALTIALLGTACSESTSPSNQEGSGSGSLKSPLPSGPAATLGDTFATPDDAIASSGDTTAGSEVVKPAFAVAGAGNATSLGFQCSSQYHWVRQYLPNMTSISGGIEKTYFWTDLYRYNGSTWVLWARRGWYNGASNSYGKLLLTAPSVYWSLNGGAVSGNYDGWNNLPSGHYATKEYYQWQNGASASRWSFVNGSGASYCTIS
jgi:hypothetical protein